MENLISIVVPCFNEEKTITFFYQAMKKIEKKLTPYEFEFIFINDGSKDTTLDIIKALAAIDPDLIKYLSFSRNFGKEAAMYAGLAEARGQYVTVMDVDLQDPPELLLEMVAILEEGIYDCVGARRVNRKDEPALRSFFARRFYKIINRISDTEIIDGVRDYRLMTRQMVDAILSLTEYNRFSKGIFSWVGFNTKYLEFENRERIAGETSWSFFGLLKYSLEGIISFSVFPLAIASFIGIFTFLLSLIFLILIVGRALLYGDPVSGWPSLISVILLLGGIQLFCIGIIGQYLGRVFTEVKKRPLYITKESNISKKTKKKR